VRLTIQPKAAYIFSLPYRNVKMTLIFSLATSCRLNSNFAFPSLASASCVHLSQEGLWWTGGSCSGEALLLGWKVKRETC